MITVIDLVKLRNAEFLTFVATYSEIVAVNDPAKLNVATQHAAFKLKLDEMSELFKRERSSIFTQALVLLDERRDDAITGFATVINGFCYHFDAETKQAARLLNESLILYGVGIARLNLQAETSTISGIVHDWETQPYLSAAITRLGLSDWVAELKTANQLFDQKYLERTREYGAANPSTMKGKREEMTVAYYELRKFIEANSIINPGAAYDKLIGELNALIVQYNLLLNTRSAEPNPESTPANN
jgi:hypothetical protein